MNTIRGAVPPQAWAETIAGWVYFTSAVIGQFSGVYQLNVVVPPVTPGDRVPLQIRLGDISSTERTTIAVSN